MIKVPLALVVLDLVARGDLDAAALTRAGRRARQAPDIDQAIGAAARDAFEALRNHGP